MLICIEYNNKSFTFAIKRFWVGLQVHLTTLKNDLKHFYSSQYYQPFHTMNIKPCFVLGYCVCSEVIGTIMLSIIRYFAMFFITNFFFSMCAFIYIITTLINSMASSCWMTWDICIMLSIIVAWKFGVACALEARCWSPILPT